MTIQTCFNLQKWGDEAKSLASVKIRLEELTRGKMEFDFLPALYSNFENIPYVVTMFPFTSEVGEAPDPVWYKNNVYPLNRDADALILVLRELEWPDNQSIAGRPYGYCSNQYPITAPPFITVLAESGDKSWKYKKISALEHYITHELAHAFANMSDVQDRTHELDYKGKIQELYDLFDYEKIKLVLKDKRKLDGRMSYYYTKPNDGTIYMLVEGKLVGFSTDFALFLKDWPQALEIKLSLDEFTKFSQSNWHTIAKRK
jgi:hypothetical protein